MWFSPSLRTNELLSQSIIFFERVGLANTPCWATGSQHPPHILSRLREGGNWIRVTQLVRLLLKNPGLGPISARFPQKAVGLPGCLYSSFKDLAGILRQQTIGNSPSNVPKERK